MWACEWFEEQLRLAEFLSTSPTHAQGVQFRKSVGMP